MHNEIVPAGEQPSGFYPYNPLPPRVPGAAGDSAPGPGKQIARLWAAVRRYKWAVLTAIAIGTIGGIVGTRFIKPEYEVFATLWLSGDSNKNQGPVRNTELVSQQGWIELLNSFEVSDAVVRKLSLFVQPENPTDSVYFRGFAIKDRMVPGDYTLKSDKAGKVWALSRGGIELDRGQFGDSVGSKLGLLWQPRSPGPDKAIKFTVNTPRDASVALRKKFVATIPPLTNFLRLKLTADNGELAATTLNRWLEEFTSVSSRLKKRNVVDFANVLEEQLKASHTRLDAAEHELESFKVNTITMPSEQGATIVAGLQETRDPVFRSFFEQKFEYENTKRDREALERLIADSRTGPNPGVITSEALLALPSVVMGSPTLKQALEDLTAKQASLRTNRQFYTDEVKIVRDIAENVRILQTQTIPQACLAMLDQLRRKEEQLASRIAGASTELKKIPTRSIEEMRLQRDVTVASLLYTALLSRFNEARLSSATTQIDVTVIDTAIAPQDPARNTAPGMIFGGVVAGLALGVALAFALDRLDRRFRYPDQATHELGLDIIGFVPSLKLTRRGERDPVATAQVVEAFRTLRLSLHHMAPPGGPVIVTVASPGTGDGKSLIASNLAVSFAESGVRTLLIDGDVRRGALHAAFSVPQTPGMVDVLGGRATLLEALRPEVQPNLALIPSGTRTARAPELLNSPLDDMFRVLRAQYDVLIVDSPPLGAGADALALGVVTGAMAIVLRAGATDRKLAEAQLRVLDKLPVRVLGAILNDVTADGAYQYYSYLSEYYQEDQIPGEEVPRLEETASER